MKRLCRHHHHRAPARANGFFLPPAAAAAGCGSRASSPKMDINQASSQILREREQGANQSVVSSIVYPKGCSSAWWNHFRGDRTICFHWLGRCAVATVGKTFYVAICHT